MRDWAFIFPGQGSQFPGMGHDLWLRFPEFRRDMQQIDTVVRDHRGDGFLDALYGDEWANAVTDLRVSHPAIFSLQYSVSQLLIRRGVQPTCLVGASLGEVAAATFAGGVGAEMAVRMICEQSDRIVEQCSPGGMVAVFARPEVWHDGIAARHECDLVSVNGPEHFVVTGGLDNLESLQAELDAAAVNYVALPVRYPFHSRRLDSLKPPARTEAGAGASLRVPFYSCAAGGRVDSLEPGHWWRVFREPIRAATALRAMAQSGRYRCVEIGPGTSMSAILRQHSIPAESSHALVTPFMSSSHMVEKLSTLSDQDPTGRGRCASTTPQSVDTTTEELRLMSPQPSGRPDGNELLAYVFPGQGSQSIGMGHELFDQHSEELAQADRILGWSVKELCLAGPKDRLDNTEFTQPALYVVNALSYLSKTANGAPLPDFVAGHSLGEYNALHAAGIVDFATGLSLVKIRGQLMARTRGGGMAVILGLGEDAVAAVLAKGGQEAVDIANLNSPEQVVISGMREDVLGCEQLFTAAGARFVPLNVSGAFHSRYMRDAREQFEQQLKGISFGRPCCPVISNVTARPYDADTARLLAEQITSPVQWVDTVRYLLRAGATLEQVGPGNVLTGLTRAIVRSDAKAQNEKTTRAEEVRRSVISGQPEPRVESAPVPAPGNETLCSAYGLKHPYVTGSMYRGIASKELVERIALAGMLGFVGTGGMPLSEVGVSIDYLQRRLPAGTPFGFNLLHSHGDPRREDELVDLLLSRGVNVIEASAFIDVSPALVRFRLNGAHRGADGRVITPHRVMAKLSRPEVAAAFMSPPPESIVSQLKDAAVITAEEASLARDVRMADDVTAEADSGGHTDAAVALTLIPTIARLRDRMQEESPQLPRVRVGGAGGIGTPESAAAAYLLGAEYIVTGSINQCTVESGASDVVKDLLQDINVQDTDYAPAGDMFELGSRVQVLRRGVFFPARANKLYSLYRQFDSWEAIDVDTRHQLEQRYFRRSFDSIWDEVKSRVSTNCGEAPTDRQKMLAVFKWYLAHSTQLALAGDKTQVVDFQVHCGPALGAFNQWVKGTEFENWRNRRVDDIGIRLMTEMGRLLDSRARGFADFAS